MSFVPGTLNVPALNLLAGTLSVLPPGMEPALFRSTLGLVDLPRAGLDYEHEILQAALEPDCDPAAIQRAKRLYQPPGRLFFALAPHARQLSGSLRLAAVSEEAPIERREDFSASLAWVRMAQGAGHLLYDRTALFDPIGDLAIAVRFLDQRGLAARWAHQKRSGNPDWVPPPSFAFLGQGETPEELGRANRGDTKRLGKVAFAFEPELQSVVPPKVYAELLRAAAGLQFVIPASHVLDSYFTKEWARLLPPNVVVATGIKGFSEGKTVREYINAVFAKIGRSSSPVGIFGYMPATRWMQEQRGERPKSDGWNILLTDPSFVNGMSLAQRWAGPEAVMRQEYVEGIPVFVVENPNFDPPLRITVLADDQVIRANELASVYKNLQALHLGRALFERMMESVRKGERWSPSLKAQFSSFYQEAMDQAKRDILAALDLEGIPELKRILMPDVEDDMYGSWGTDQFKEMYELVRQIFHEHSSPERWQEGMVLLKLRIRDYYSVRNPCYGFCLAADDEAAVVAQRWMRRKDVEDTAARLRARGELALSDQEIAERLELSADGEIHYFFSMIPAGLHPEALQIAEQLPARYGKTVMKKRLADSFNRAYLSVERRQDKMPFDARIYRDIVELTRTLARVFAGSPDGEPERYGRLMARLLNLFRAALRSAQSYEQSSGKRRSETTVMLRRLVGNLEPFVQRLATNDRLTPEHIVLVNQAVIEALTAANLFFILPPQEKQREVKHLLERTAHLRDFVSGGFEFSHLFSTPEAEPPLAVADGDRLSRLQNRLYQDVGAGLIELTYRMNVKFHQEDWTIVKRDITVAVSQIEQAVAAVVGKMREDPEMETLLADLQTVLGSIREKVEGKKLQPKDRLLVFQSLIEALIHTRRFLVFPEDRAGVELGYTMKRFAKIAAYLDGEARTPLWNFGNGSTPPPAAPSESG